MKPDYWKYTVTGQSRICKEYKNRIIERAVGIVCRRFFLGSTHRHGARKKGETHMKKTWIVTVGREFSSGGLDVAKALSERMNVPYYDRDLIDHAVELTNLSREEVEANEERGEVGRRGLLYGRKWYRDDPELMLPVHMRIYQAQCDAIRHLAGEGNGIFVGRCADFVLGECDQVVSLLKVFVRADMDFRLKRTMKNLEIGEDEARRLIARIDKIRARYYNGHTKREWGDAGNYNLVVDTSLLGIDGAASVIEAAVKQL